MSKKRFKNQKQHTACWNHTHNKASSQNKKLNENKSTRQHANTKLWEDYFRNIQILPDGMGARWRWRAIYSLTTCCLSLYSTGTLKKDSSIIWEGVITVLFWTVIFWHVNAFHSRASQCFQCFMEVITCLVFLLKRVGHKFLIQVWLQYSDLDVEKNASISNYT